MEIFAYLCKMMNKYAKPILRFVYQIFLNFLTIYKQYKNIAYTFHS